MAGITIRSVDDEILAWLRERATRRGTSMNTELLEILSVAHGDETASGARGPAAASARKARALGVRTRRSANLLRRDRETRR